MLSNQETTLTKLRTNRKNAPNAISGLIVKTMISSGYTVDVEINSASSVEIRNANATRIITKDLDSLG